MKKLYCSRNLLTKERNHDETPDESAADALSAHPLSDRTRKPIPTIDYDSIPEPREGLHHYLLLCSDQWTNKLVNTDGIVIVTLDTVTHRIMLTSIIRDALVERPDGVIGRINYIARNSGKRCARLSASTWASKLKSTFC